MERASRPDQSELLGTSDTPPYRVFWRPPADQSAGDELTFIATVDDLRGHRASARIGRIHVAPPSFSFGIRGAEVPVFNFEPGPVVSATVGKTLTLSASASGTGPLEFRWLHDGSEIAGASQASLTLADVSAASAGHYLVLVHNREGTAISRDIEVSVGP